MRPQRIAPRAWDATEQGASFRAEAARVRLDDRPVAPSCRGTLPELDLNLAGWALRGAGRHLDANIHVEGDQVSDEPVNGEAGEVASHQVRNLRLGGPE